MNSTNYYGNSIQFVGPNPPDEIQLLKTGTFDDGFQEFVIEEDDLTTIAKNYTEKVRKIDLAVDLSHENHKDAAGWFKHVYTRKQDTELWAAIDWTVLGKDKISKRQFKYTSAEFSFNYTDNESGEDFGPTLFGCALTNRPFLKGMTPVFLSERNKLFKENKTMAKKEEIKVEMVDHSKELSELKNKLDVLLSENKSLKTERETEKAAKILSEKNISFDELLRSNKVCEAQREAFLSGDVIAFANKIEITQSRSKGTSEQKGEESFSDSQDEILAKAKKYAEENKVSFSEAISSVLRENQALAKKYYSK
jgi:phage I-like protein